MTNPPKIKGTKAESALVNYARVRGFPNARRLTLCGNKDLGDVLLGSNATGTSVAIVECKATGGDVQLGPWIGELIQECRNWDLTEGTPTTGILAVKYRGVGPRNVPRWLGAMPYDWYRANMEAAERLTLLPELRPAIVNGSRGYVDTFLRGDVEVLPLEAVCDEYFPQRLRVIPGRGDGPDVVVGPVYEFLCLLSIWEYGTLPRAAKSEHWNI